MQILVAHGKHGTSYFDASTPEALAKSSLYLLRQRFEGNWYYDPYPSEQPISTYAKEQAELLDMTDEQLEALPESIKGAVLHKRSVALHNKKLDDDLSDWYRRAKKVVENNDVSTVTIGRGRFVRHLPVAWVLLDERSDWEYERVELVSTIEVPDD